MIGGVQPKVLVDLTNEGELIINTEFASVFDKNTQHKWKLVRELDGLTKTSNDIMWIEWDKHGMYKDQFKEIKMKRSLIMSPFNNSFTWQTTEVIEIIEQRDDYFKFKTTNSIYELFKETVCDYAI
jgi:hypothetical protein